MKPGLAIGQIGRMDCLVGAHQAIYLGADGPVPGSAVFSTPAMIHLMEMTAREVIRPYLEPGEASVGVKVEVEHLSPTPVGASARAEAKVTGVAGTLVDFDVAAFDAAGPIGRGTHRRAVIKIERSRQKLAEKIAQHGEGMVWPMEIQPDTGNLPALTTLAARQEGAVLTVTLNRPAALNAVDVQMTGEWEKILAWLAGHADSVRVVIVTGAGRAFCAGDDVKEVGTLDPGAAERLSLRQARLYLAFEQVPQPVIAAVNGHCYGGGCVCAVACDFRIASTQASFGMPEILLGWPPGYGVAQLTALVGKARALELCLTGKPISARGALEWGLVHQVVPSARLMPAAMELAKSLLAIAPAALRETKRLLHSDEGVQPKITHIADTAAYIRCLGTADAQEGIAAFAQKRKARFSGQ